MRLDKWSYFDTLGRQLPIALLPAERRRPARPSPLPSASRLPNPGPRPGGFFYQPQLTHQSGSSSLTTLQLLNSAHFSQKLIDLLSVTAAETGCWFAQKSRHFWAAFLGDFCSSLVVYKLSPEEVRARLKNLLFRRFSPHSFSLLTGQIWQLFPL